MTGASILSVTLSLDDLVGATEALPPTPVQPTPPPGPVGPVGGSLLDGLEQPHLGG
jgi:hypothetical protein